MIRTKVSGSTSYRSASGQPARDRSFEQALSGTIVPTGGASAIGTCPSHLDPYPTHAPFQDARMNNPASAKAFGRPRIFRDPVHGDIAFARGPFQRLLESVIDTEMFQRLRGIRQPAVMNLVFHGAEHSMGAAHVAGRMVEAAAANSGVVVSSAAWEETVLAALLHDVGHGPFS